MTLLLAFFALRHLPAVHSSAIKPNIVLIVADDQGYANIGYHNKTVLTPRIDNLAALGVILDTYYVQPVCSPTRSSLMTGRYTYRLGTQATVIRADTPFGVPLKETFMSENLKDAGYDTALFGKWHLGFFQRPYTPLARGFDEHLGYFQGAIDYYTHDGGAYGGTHAGVDWHRGNQTTCFADNGTYTAELIVPEAVKYLEKRGKAARVATDSDEEASPFFLLLPFHLIHGPNQVPQRYIDLYPELDPKKLAAEQGMCGVCECSNPDGTGYLPELGYGQIPYSNATWQDCRTVLGMAAALDWAVGSIVDALHSTGLWNNTLIVYTSDNGAQPGQGGTSYPLKGFKTQLYEGGMRVPGFISGGTSLIPDAIRGTVNEKLYHVTDWLPTLVKSVAGGETSRNEALDGLDIWQSIVDPAEPSPRSEMLLNINPACGKGFVFPDAGIRVGDWKLLVGCYNTTTLTPTGKIELYDIGSDPFEKHDQSKSRPDVVANLLNRLKDYAVSPDQVPPTIFPPFNEKYARADGKLAVAPWNYQCPQCPQHGALPSAKGWHVDPWCDSVQCVPLA